MSAGAGDVPVLQAASLPWGRISFQFFLFASHFAIFGALSFRFLVLRRARGLFAGADTAPLMAVVAAVERGAARVGMGGSLLLLADLVSNAARNAAAQQVTILSALLPAKPAFLTQLLCALLLILAFAAALRGSRRAWGGAAVAGAAMALRNILLMDATALLNSLHEVSASLWLGTLFVLVTAALPAILAGKTPNDQRGRLVADLVGVFSPLALGSAMVAGLTGIANAYVHLKYLAALWTMPYGYALSAKLCVVAGIVAVGAWNWRRMLPKLGSEEAARRVRRSSTVEVVLAAVVLMLTALMLGLPEPKLPSP